MNKPRKMISCVLRSILSEIEDVLAYGHKYQHSFNKRQVNLR